MTVILNMHEAKCVNKRLWILKMDYKRQTTVLSVMFILVEIGWDAAGEVIAVGSVTKVIPSSVSISSFKSIVVTSAHCLGIDILN
jgi:hypothetical protein